MEPELSDVTAFCSRPLASLPSCLSASLVASVTVTHPETQCPSGHVTSPDKRSVFERKTAPIGRLHGGGQQAFLTAIDAIRILVVVYVLNVLSFCIGTPGIAAG